MWHVLVVDDEPDVTLLFQAYLEAAGYRVTVAHDGLMGLEADEHDPVDAVVTDLSMPRMDGREMLHRLRQRRASLPAVVVSGFASNLQWSEPHLVVLSKPVSMATVEQHLANLLADVETVQRLQA